MHASVRVIVPEQRRRSRANLHAQSGGIISVCGLLLRAYENTPASFGVAIKIIRPRGAGSNASPGGIVSKCERVIRTMKNTSAS